MTLLLTGASLDRQFIYFLPPFLSSFFEAFLSNDQSMCAKLKCTFLGPFWHWHLFFPQILTKDLKYEDLKEIQHKFTNLEKCKNICKWSKRVWQAASRRGRRSTFEPSTGFRAYTSLLPLLATSLLALLALLALVY